MSSSSPLRLDAKLVREAKATARIYKRSVPRQIEYWAELGRAVESMLTPEQLIAVRQGVVRIAIESADSRPVSADEVFADIDNRRARGELASRVAEAGVRYQRSESHPGRLERIGDDGTRTVGGFEDGRFVPDQP